MANPDYAEDKRGLGGRAVKPPKTGQRATSKPGMTVKSGFPGMGAPGRKQRNRSAGIKRAKIHPSSDGL